LNEVRLAFAFLSRLPVGTPRGGAPEHAVSTRFYPLVGAAVATVVVLVLLGGAWCFDRGVACVLAVAAWVLVTGGLHIDGLADCFDGLATHGAAERRIQAMKDPGVGGLGAVGVALWLLLKVALLARCLDQGTIAQGIWCAAVFARAPLAFELTEGEPVTPGRGLFGWLHGEMRRVDWLTSLLVASLLLLPASAPWGGMLVRVLVGGVFGAGASLAWHLAWYRRIGGLNGDVLGGAVEIREVLMLAAMGISLPW
jgi:adenosylcobinamide-GDP ribazoletransferase